MFSAPVFADMPKQIDKLTNGVVDIVTSPLELIIDEADHMPLGLLKGLVESPFHMVKKAGHGAINVVTFLID